MKEYTYDENGNRKTFKLTVGGTQQIDATYTYDKLNQLASVTIGGDTTTYGYDDNGNILNKTTGELVTAYTYNSGNMLTNMATNQGSNSLYTYTSSYYLDGNKQTANDGGTVSQYQYNGLGQLLTETQGTMYLVIPMTRMATAQERRRREQVKRRPIRIMLTTSC